MGVEDRLRDVELKLEMILDLIGKKRPPAQLTRKQHQVFQDIDRVRGMGIESVQKIQRLLALLKDEPVTEPLTRAFKEMLKERGWKVRCTYKGCGEPSAPFWQRNRGAAQGGYMRLCHGGKKHGTWSRFEPPILTIGRSSKSTGSS